MGEYVVAVIIATPICAAIICVMSRYLCNYIDKKADEIADRIGLTMTGEEEDEN